MRTAAVLFTTASLAIGLTLCGCKSTPDYPSLTGVGTITLESGKPLYYLAPSDGEVTIFDPNMQVMVNQDPIKLKMNQVLMLDADANAITVDGQPQPHGILFKDSKFDIQFTPEKMPG